MPRDLPDDHGRRTSAGQLAKMTPTQRTLRARVAANDRWARTPAAERRARALAGQAGLLAKFEREIDPDGTLPPAELAKQVENARQAHMARLALASSRARRKGGGEAVA